MNQNSIYKTLEENYITYNNQIISVITDKNEKIWFNAHEVCESLKYKNPKLTVNKNVKKTNKMQLCKIDTNIQINRHPHSIYIDEAGLYTLILKSRLESAEQFKDWITEIVIPSIRKYGTYELKKKHLSEKNNIMKKISFYEKQINVLKNDLKKDDFPEGGLIYVLDYSDDEEGEIYRLGETGDLKKRKQVTDTHLLHKKNVVYYKKVINPYKLELCVRTMLYDYRYKNKKDFYICPLETIIKAIKVCIKEQQKIMNQTGGGGHNNTIMHNLLLHAINEKELLDMKIDYLTNLLI